MIDYRNIEAQLTANLQLRHRPVAITFLQSVPPGVRMFTGRAPSACSFWRLAADGESICTVASDHHNCPIGAYTHNVPLPAERAHELDETLQLMSSIGYIRMEEVPGIPRLPESPAAILYQPLGEATADPDLALFMDRAGAIMLLQEAAIRAGLSSQLNVLSRPTCMALPASLESGLVASTGCVGNRVYTGLDDSELYVAVHGRHLPRLAQETSTIAGANAKLVEYHTQRRSTLSTLPHHVGQR